jgi:CDP-diacylglycerol--inositol 3-phosphatidyltransferase
LRCRLLLDLSPAAAAAAAVVAAAAAAAAAAVLRFVCDELDGRAARTFNQTSTMGAVLDMVTDR